MSELVVAKGMIVTLHFSLQLEDGTVIDSNFDSDPAAFEVGDGQLLPGFENVLAGLAVGDEKEVLILPEQGFGVSNPNNKQTIKRAQFPDDIKLEPGLMLSFADAQSAERPGVVVEYDESTVLIDFNHPLADRSIIFNVRIINVKPSVTH